MWKIKILTAIFMLLGVTVLEKNEKPRKFKRL